VLAVEVLAPSEEEEEEAGTKAMLCTGAYSRTKVLCVKRRKYVASAEREARGRGAEGTGSEESGTYSIVCRRSEV